MRLLQNKCLIIFKWDKYQIPLSKIIEIFNIPKLFDEPLRL